MSLFEGLVFSFLSLSAWAFSDLVTKMSLDKSSKWKVLLFGQLFGSLVILASMLVLGGSQNFVFSSLPLLFGLGLVNLAGMYTQYAAFNKKGIALTTPIINAWAFVAIILGIVFYNETISHLQIAAIVLIVLGVFATVFKKDAKIAFNEGFFLSVASMLVWGFFFFALKPPVFLFGALAVTFIVKLSTSLFSLPVALVKKVDLLETRQKTLLLICLVGFLDGLGFLAYNLAVGLAPVSIVAPIVSSVPALSVFLAVIFLKERLSQNQKIGIIATIVGILLVSF